jgi:hypothetical protein
VLDGRSTVFAAGLVPELVPDIQRQLHHGLPSLLFLRVASRRATRQQKGSIGRGS